MVRGAHTPIDRRQGGASLVETLVALTIMAVAILWTMILLVEAPRIERRLEARQEAARLMEAELEVIRSGPRLPRDGEEIDLSALPSVKASQDLRMWAHVATEPGRSLRRLTLQVRYTAGGRQYDHQLETLVFVP